MEFTKVSASTFVALVIGLILGVGVPIAIAIYWTIKKKEKFTTILVGAATWLLFAIIIEKPIQNVLIFPTTMGLPDHGVAQFINARPVFMAILLGLFPGVFEETGRLVAFKTLLKKRTNKETGISHGIGHGGFEIMFILGLTFFEYIVYGIMINTGAMNDMMSQIAAVAPDQVDQYFEAFNSISTFTFASLGVYLYERVFAFLIHVGLSIFVFYACRDKGKIWLYPLAILIHTVIDGLLGFSMVGLVELNTFTSEAWVTITSLLTFLAAYFLLYKRDRGSGPLSH